MSNRVKPDADTVLNAEIQHIYVDRIGKLMLKHNESQPMLADAIGVNRDKINNWLGYRSKPDFASLVKLAQHYSVSVDYLLGLANEPTNDWDVERVCEFTSLSDTAVSILNNKYLMKHLERSFVRYMMDSILDLNIINTIIENITASANTALIDENDKKRIKSMDEDALDKKRRLQADVINYRTLDRTDNDGSYSLCAIDAKGASAFFRRCAIDAIEYICTNAVDQLIEQVKEEHRELPGSPIVEFRNKIIDRIFDEGI